MAPVPPGLSSRFTKAIAMAQHEHRADLRKGTQIPYLAHLLSVCALVLEHGGTEYQAIAALLHDSAEDHGGQTMIDEIRSAFGDAVADIVAACSDSLTEDSKNKLSWWPRKVAYLDHLADAPADALLVSAADKLHNARSILADYRALGDELWSRFNSDAGRMGTLWYYTRLTESLAARLAGVASTDALVDELRRTVGAICDHATALGHDVAAELAAGRAREANSDGAGIELARFEVHHPADFDRAFAEVQRGRKSSHWMWFIFPQLTELGHSSTARAYGINSVEEVEAYLRHAVLGADYAAIIDAVACQLRSGVKITAMMGTPDDLKLVSSLTLFGGVARRLEGNEFAALADRCDEALAVAEQQGFAACNTTRSFLSRRSA